MVFTPTSLDPPNQADTLSKLAAFAPLADTSSIAIALLLNESEASKDMLQGTRAYTGLQVL